jgi:hypothetical protein
MDDWRPAGPTFFSAARMTGFGGPRAPAGVRGAPPMIDVIVAVAGGCVLWAVYSRALGALSAAARGPRSRAA